MNCKQCGSTLRENAKFCDECGEKIVPLNEIEVVKQVIVSQEIPENSEVVKLLENKLKREEEKIEKKKKRKVKRKKLFKGFAISLVVLIILALVGTVIYLSANYVAGKNLQEDGNYKDALVKYNIYGLNYLTADDKAECVQQVLDSGDINKIISCFEYEPSLFSSVSFNETVKDPFYNYLVDNTRKYFNAEKSNLDYNLIGYYEKILKKNLKGYKNSDAYADFFNKWRNVYYSSWDTDVLVADILEDYLYTSLPEDGVYQLALELLLCNDLILPYLSNQDDYYEAQVVHENMKKRPESESSHTYSYFIPDSQTDLYSVCVWKDKHSDQKFTFYSKSSGGHSCGGDIKKDDPYKNVSGSYFYLEDCIYYTGTSETDRKAHCKITILNYNEIEVENYYTGKTTIFKRDLSHSVVT